MAGGRIWWCGELPGCLSNPFWGFIWAEEVRARGGGVGGSRAEQGKVAVALQWRSGQGKGWKSISGWRGSRG